MSRFIFCHSSYTIPLVETDKRYQTLHEYVTWFCYEHTCLYEWNTLMHWEMNHTDNIIEITCRTKEEGHRTLCFRHKQSNNTFYIPFSYGLTYSQLRTIFSLFIPDKQITCYRLKDNMYYMPTDDAVFVPEECTECIMDDSVYPFALVCT